MQFDVNSDLAIESGHIIIWNHRRPFAETGLPGKTIPRNNILPNTSIMYKL
jgi:hypothetical protein